MALSDAQIDRFSRQIILPQIGGVGQERLLRSSVAVGGDGDLADLVALSLAGAGIGRIALHGAGREGLRRDLVDLTPDVQATVAAGALDSAGCDLLVTCDLRLAELDRAATAGRPLVAGGVDGRRGWLVVAEAPVACASCAARAAVRALGSGPRGRAAVPVRAGTGPAAPQSDDRREPLSSSTAGVVGSLMCLEVLKLLLGLGASGQRVWLHFDATRSTLTEHPFARAADCPACAVG